MFTVLPTDLNFFNDQDIYIESACVIKSLLTDWNKECEWLQKQLKFLDNLG